MTRRQEYLANEILKFYSGDYLFVYASDDNNVVVLIQTTPDTSDTPEADIPYEEVVDTMGDDMLYELELKMVRYVMTLILAVRRNMELMMKINLCLMPLKKILEINYTYSYMKQPTEKYILWKVKIFSISQRMGDIDG